MRFSLFHICFGLCFLLSLSSEAQNLPTDQAGNIQSKPSDSDPENVKQTFSTKGPTVAINPALLSKSIQAPIDSSIFTKFIIVPYDPQGQKPVEKNNTKALESKQKK